MPAASEWSVIAAQSSGRLSFTGWPSEDMHFFAAREPQRLLRPERRAEGARIHRPAGMDMLVAPEDARRIVATGIRGEAALRKGVRRSFGVHDADVGRGRTFLREDATGERR